MMNYCGLLAEQSVNLKDLTNKKVQTQYKIKYISEYVKQWMYVFLNIPTKNNINFVDAMSNAGIYADGELTTSMEVMVLFCTEAKRHPDKQFHVFLNDIEDRRIQICKGIAEFLYKENGQPPNVFLHYSVLDVNEYLLKYDLFDRFVLRNAATIFFIDPYDIRTVIISSISKLVKRYYCEIIFNVITNDFIRNKNDSRINQCLGQEEIYTKEDLMEHIARELKVGYIKHSFAYQFNNVKNTEIYQILYATPHPEGLRKLKDALWNTFDGSEFFKSPNQALGQMSLLSTSIVQESNSDYYAREARELLVHEFDNRTVGCNEIELFLLERTMLRSTGYIESVIKPLMESGIIMKMGYAKSNNYKNDSYRFSKGSV